MDYSYKIGRFSKGIFGTIEKKRWNLLKLCELFEASTAEIDGTGRLLRMPALLRLDLHREGVAGGVGRLAATS